MTVGLIGHEPVLTAVADQVSSTEREVSWISVDDIASVDLVVVAADTDAEIFTAVNDAMLAHHVPVIAIELQGRGGYGDASLHASISALTPDGPCYACLQARVQSADPTDEPVDELPTTANRIVGAHAGAVAVSMREHGTAAVASRVIEIPYRERHLLPVPGCAACEQPGKRWTSDDSGTSRGLHDAIEAAERCTDDRIGLILEIGEAASLPLPYYLATLADTSVFSDATAPRQAAGVSEDWDRAYMKGMGEALERYAAGCFRMDSFKRGAPGDLDQTVHPDDCVRPSDTGDSPESLLWAPGTDLRSESRIWIPADLVVFPPPDTYVRPAITTGLALGNTKTEATLSGLLEVIERDATMLSWYSTFDPIGLSVEDSAFRALHRFASVEDLTIQTVLLTQDIDVPVVGAFVHRDGAFPQVAAGSAAAFEPVEAATNAAREAIQNWMELSEMGEDMAHKEAPRLATHAVDPTGLESYLHPDVTIDAADMASVAMEPDEQLAQLIDVVSEGGMTSAVADLTTRDLRAVGFCAVRVVVPSAQPLILNTTYFGDRAEAVPRTMGFASRLDRSPHPFP